jgi:hypothetical protein
LIAAQRVGLLDDLLFVAADERAQDRHLDRFFDHRQIVQGLGGDLPQAFPGDQGLGVLALRDLRRDPGHEPPIQHHP